MLPLIGGQIRVGFGAVAGWDMTAVLATARALGIDEAAVAELLPTVEAVMVRQTNQSGEPRA